MTAGADPGSFDADDGLEPGEPVGGRPSATGPFHVAVVDAPWGPVHVAATRQAILGIAVLTPREPFITDVMRRTGCDPAPGAGNPLLERAVAALRSFLAGDPAMLESLPLDLADRGAWDRNVLGGVRTLRWGEVTSYGRLARAIGRRGAARAVGGAVGRNPIGLAIPCHRVIAGDGTIGGYGGDWFGSRDELLAIKRELLAMEDVALPARSLRD
ncbi:MAG TPA: methylated-DNA--[protein]-cysteine S-methyltransferase [Candidatus Limnocylindrales bacterium]|nr:methylated-DNA--[protein]-cysteine S-methyltransferase [Candidatus Limnocylindrales bacterium]